MLNIISSARQSRVPATVRASKQGGVWGAQPPQHCKRIVARIWVQLILKAFQNPSKNPSKMIPKSFQIVVKMVQSQGLEGVWGFLWRVFAPRRLWAAS